VIAAARRIRVEEPTDCRVVARLLIANLRRAAECRVHVAPPLRTVRRRVRSLACGHALVPSAAGVAAVSGAHTAEPVSKVRKRRVTGGGEAASGILRQVGTDREARALGLCRLCEQRQQRAEGEAEHVNQRFRPDMI
jgi:hypothetical protein